MSPATQKTSHKRIIWFIALLLLLSLTATAIGAAPAPRASQDFVSEPVGEIIQGAPKSYVVVMEGLPLVAYEGDISGFAATKAAMGSKVDTNTANARSYQAYLQAAHNEALAGVGASAKDKLYSYTVALNGFAAVLSAEQARDMANQKGVLLVLEDQMRYPDTDSSPAFIGLTKKGEAWMSGVTGEDVVVGVIDTGIWPEHPSFADDGSYGPSPISTLPCEFGNTAHNPADLPFSCNNKLLGARQMLATYRTLTGVEAYEYDSARDDGGHGTHTASTAAGNSGVAASIYGMPKGVISGIAPRARVVAYKGLGELGGYTSDLAAAVDQAVADGVDVINYSVGGGAGGPGPDEIAFLFAADAGVFVATSAGNSGPGPATLGNPGTMPWLTTVGASTQKRFFRGDVYLYGGGVYKGASITGGTTKLPLVDAEFAGDELCGPGNLDPGIVAGKIVLCRRGAYARADKSRAVWMAGGAGMVMYNLSDDNDLSSDSHWVPSVHVDLTPGLAIKAYIASSPNPTARILTKKPSNWPKAPTMASFSSRGPNPVVPDIIKPDITAPGVQILAGYSPTSYEVYDLPGEMFAAIQGTSMSSPHIAGVFALLKQAHPEWSAAEARSAIMTSSYDKGVRDNDRSSSADPFDYGAGHVKPGKVAQRGSAFAPGLVYDAGWFEYAAFTCGMDWGVFTPGSCDFLEGIGVPSEPYNLNYPSIGIGQLAGSQTVVRTVTASLSDWDVDHGRGVTFKAKVKAPPGYKVQVVPNRITLKDGETATYEVTITNKNAPIGEWRFGTLIWQGGGYGARSPIAVNGSLFGAPNSVSGSGETGAAAFPVSFGYSGSYSAAAHGLEPAIVTSDNVLQDPDQTFDPT